MPCVYAFQRTEVWICVVSTYATKFAALVVFFIYALDYTWRMHSDSTCTNMMRCLTLHIQTVTGQNNYQTPKIQSRRNILCARSLTISRFKKPKICATPSTVLNQIDGLIFAWESGTNHTSVLVASMLCYGPLCVV